MTVLRPDKRVIREASVWFARMHDPDAADHRTAFDAWMAESIAHRDAYSRVSEAFSLGKNLQHRRSSPSEIASPPLKRRIRKLAPATAVAILGASVGVLLLDRHGSVDPQASIAIASADNAGTRVGEIRTLRLADGSRVTLDTDSQLITRFKEGQRDLWLVRGRARFDVAHEPRPFVVHTPGGTVTAHGTLFDVRVGAGAVSVQLIRGAIDVGLAVRAGRSPQQRRMMPGEAVTFSEAQGITTVSPTQTATIAQPTWPDALLEFDATRVADVAAEANRYSSTRLIVDDTRIGDMRVSGTFRVGDTARLADRLATLLGLKVDRLPGGDVALHDASS